MHSRSTPRGGGVRLRALTLATSVALVALLIPATAGGVLGWNGLPGAILPTNTTCSDFVNNTTPALADIFYKAPGGIVAQSIHPGVFFYYTYIDTTVANQVVTTSQEVATGSGPLFTLNQGHAQLYTLACGLVSNSPTLAGTTATFTIATPGTYVLRLQYSTKSIVGLTAPTLSPSHYCFDNGVSTNWNACVYLVLQ